MMFSIEQIRFSGSDILKELYRNWNSYLRVRKHQVRLGILIQSFNGFRKHLLSNCGDCWEKYLKKMKLCCKTDHKPSRKTEGIITYFSPFIYRNTGFPLIVSCLYIHILKCLNMYNIKVAIDTNHEVLTWYLFISPNPHIHLNFLSLLTLSFNLH